MPGSTNGEPALDGDEQNDPRAVGARDEVEIPMKVAPNRVVNVIGGEEVFVNPREQHWDEQNRRVRYCQTHH